MRHFLRDDDLSPAEQREVLELALAMKAEPYARKPLGRPAEPWRSCSTSPPPAPGSRSRSASPTSRQPLVMDTGTTQIGRGEPVADTARVLGRMTSAIVWRTYAQAAWRTWPPTPACRS